MIQHYLILRAKEKYRATDHPFRLSFINTNIVCPVNPQLPGFPLIAHNALPFSEVENRIGSNVLMSDVIALVTGITDFLPPTVNAREPRRQIFITNRQYTIIFLTFTAVYIIHE
ncbi:hypothetical protein VPH35_099121 [Triticum aestivum]|uniref:DUF223 domain-containing protein n=1 Tax=Aegilops tauschii subsp. strangulata TaxID=200361 RepID=A0A453LGN9_AEGTS